MAGDGYTESWAYVTVRPGAHLFYWLYQNNTLPAASSPLVIWSNGGPGASGIGYGSYSEFGPVDTNLQPRPITWLSAANLLVLDQPVGTGYSYVDDLSLLTTDVAQIASDLVTLFQNFTGSNPSFQSAPTILAAESYGGKMFAAAAQASLAAIDAGTLKMNLQGVALGDSWIDGLSYVQAWGPWLRELSVMDAWQLNSTVQPDVDATTQAVAAGDWEGATNAWGAVENDVEATTDGISFYNVLQHNVADDDTSSLAMGADLAVPPLSPAAASVAPAGVDLTILAKLYARHVRNLGRDSGSPTLGMDLSSLMNGPVKAKLGVIPPGVTWGGQSDAVFSAQSGDFMKPVVSTVDALLKDGRLNVIVYNGQLDLICCTSGTEAWMSTLTWSGLQGFLQSSKTPLYPSSNSQNTGAFKKASGKLSMYYIMTAGHMVPADNPVMGLAMIQDIFANLQ